MIAAVRNHLIIAIFAVATFSPCVADSKSVKDMFAEVSGGIVVVLALDGGGKQTGQGSGVVVGKNEVVTNCHVVSGARTIAIRQAADVRGRETYRMEAKLVARIEQRDLCLLSVKELSAPPAATPVPLATAHSVSIGEEIYAIGAPQGLELSISRGIVSQLRGDYGKQSAPIIQTDAAISPGSSGGGLFNENGELIGITTFKLSGGASEGLSFALPVEWVKDLVPNVQKRKKCFSSPTVKCLFDEALRITKDIETGPGSLKLVNETLCTIASAQAEAGDRAEAKMTLTDAIRVAERIDDTRTRDRGFSDIASGQIEAGDIVGATQTTGRINNPIKRASTLNKIAIAQAEAGNKPGASLTLETAIQVLENFKKSTAQTKSQATTTSKSWAEAGMKMLDIGRLPYEIRSIAKTQALTGHITDALRTVERIDDAGNRTSGFLDIAAVQAEAGDKAGAKKTLTDAIRNAEKIDDTRTHDKRFLDITTAQAKAGDIIGAIQTAARINDNMSIRISALNKIATAQAEAGDRAEAKKTLTDAIHVAEKIDDADARDLAAQLHALGLDGAAERIDGAGMRDSGFLNIAVTQAETDDIVGATQTAGRINNASKRASALNKIAIAQAQPGDEVSAKVSLTDALRAAMRIDDAETRARRFIEVATAQVQGGNEIGAKAIFANAMQIVKEINDRNTFTFGRLLPEKEQSMLDALSTASSRVSVLRDIAVAQAETGNIKGAMNTALNLSHGVIVEDRFILESLASETKAKRAVAFARIAVAIARTK